MDTQMSLLQEQIQKLSASQIQSLAILSLSSEDLRELLQKESEENPFMDYHPSSHTDGAAEFLRFVAAPEKDRIKTFILEQLNPSHFSKPHWALLSYLAQCVDAKGYLTVTEEELAQRIPLPDGLFAACLQTLQNLQPAGIGAQSVADCLKIQLRRSGNLSPLAVQIIDTYMEELGAGHIQAICKALRLPRAKVLPVIRCIRKLDPAPLKGMFDGSDAYVVPDVIIRLTADGHETMLNDSWIASYSISDKYIDMMRKTTDPDIKDYFKQKYTRCYMLLNNIERRRQTLITLTDAIWDWQYDYIRRHRALRPMTLQDIAGTTGFHISTVSRSIKDKYLQSPWRTLPFKRLFQSPLHTGPQPVSKDAVQRRLRELIASENPAKPYSDDQLKDLLSRQFQTTLSRRVVQKYRNRMHIANSYNRK